VPLTRRWNSPDRWVRQPQDNDVDQFPPASLLTSLESGAEAVHKQLPAQTTEVPWSDVIAAFRRGQPAVLDLVYRTYAPRLARYIHALTFDCGSWSGQDDLQQETFVHAFQPAAR